MDKQEKIISIGTVLKGGLKSLDYIDRFMPAGIESVQIHFWGIIPPEINQHWAEELASGCSSRNLHISALSLYADPFAEGEAGILAAEGWPKLMNLARTAGVPVVSGFTGRLPDEPVEKSYEPVTRFFSPIIDKCENYGLKIAFENCAMGGNKNSGSWNIAFIPEVWHELLNKRLASNCLGLEFDPSHCIRAGLPVIQLIQEWQKFIFHVHGKDSSGENGEDRFPGVGSMDWSEIFEALKSCGFRGSVDIEGYHGEFVSHDKEYENQNLCVEYLKNCRKDYF